jgi:ATP adenylyltransferase
MVAPYRHTGDLHDLSEDELKELFVLIRRCKDVLQKAFNPDGFNMGMNLGRVAGAGIADHIHLHLVPRWNGDTNFMTVVGDTRVVSNGLDEIHKKLTEVAASI